MGHPDHPLTKAEEPAATPPASAAGGDKIDVVKQFDILAAQLRFEFTVMWTRLGFLLTIQGVLLAIFFRMVELDGKKDTPNMVVWTQLGLPVVGVILIFVFWRMLEVTEEWVKHWNRLIHHYQGRAYPDAPVKFFPQRESPGGVSQFSSAVQVLFVLVWIILACNVVIRHFVEGR